MIRRILDTLAVVAFVAFLPLLAVAQSGVSAISASPGAKPGPGTKTTCTVAGGVWRTSSPAATLDCGAGLTYDGTTFALTGGMAVTNSTATYTPFIFLNPNTSATGRAQIVVGSNDTGNNIQFGYNQANFSLGAGFELMQGPRGIFAVGGSGTSGLSIIAFGGGPIIFANGPATADERMRIDTTSGSVGIGDATPDYLFDVAGTFGVDGVARFGASLVYASTIPAVSNTSANSCGTDAATIAGTSETGIITVGATSGTSCTMTFPVAAPNRRQCVINNETTANLARAVYSSTTVSLFEGTFVGGDVISYVCQVY